MIEDEWNVTVLDFEPAKKSYKKIFYFKMYYEQMYAFKRKRLRASEVLIYVILISLCTQLGDKNVTLRAFYIREMTLIRIKNVRRILEALDSKGFITLYS